MKKIEEGEGKIDKPSEEVIYVGVSYSYLLFF